MPNIKDITIINREFTYQGQRFVFVFIGKENNNAVAWIVGESLEDNDEPLHKMRRLKETNRQAMNHRFERERTSLISLRKLEIKGYELKVASSSSEGGGIYNEDVIHTVQYMWMIWNGCDLGELEHVSMKKLYLMKFTFREDTDLPMIKKDEQLKIKLTFDKRYEAVRVQKSICVKMGEYSNKKYRFKDREAAEERIVYVDRLIHYDVWADAEIKFNDPFYREKLTEEQIEEMKQNYLESLSDMCPQGMDLAILEYETKNNIILDIYTKEFLKKEVGHKSSSMMVKPESKSLNGYCVRACVLGVVEKDFDGEMKLEIIGYLREIPGEVMEI